MTLFVSDVWDNITFTGGETKNPKRNIPRGLFFGTIILTVLYILVSLLYPLVLPLESSPNFLTISLQLIQFALEDSVVAATANLFLG